MGNRSTLNVVMKRGTRLLASRYGLLANTPVHRGLGLEQRRFVQNFAWETSVATAAAATSSDASSMEDRQRASGLQLEECQAFTSYHPFNLDAGSGRDRQVIVAGLMAPCLCKESVLPDQASRMEPALHAQELGPSGLRKVAEHYST
jgi:hypothetical protein